MAHSATCSVTSSTILGALKAKQLLAVNVHISSIQ
jgi:hypothetical protein